MMLAREQPAAKIQHTKGIAMTATGIAMIAKNSRELDIAFCLA
jgi:hypothetical protein